jgi:hypothetical protein
MSLKSNIESKCDKKEIKSINNERKLLCIKQQFNNEKLLGNMIIKPAYQSLNKITEGINKDILYKLLLKVLNNSKNFLPKLLLFMIFILIIKLIILNFNKYYIIKCKIKNKKINLYKKI